MYTMLILAAYSSTATVAPRQHLYGMLPATPVSYRMFVVDGPLPDVFDIKEKRKDVVKLDAKTKEFLKTKRPVVRQPAPLRQQPAWQPVSQPITRYAQPMMPTPVVCTH